MRQTWVNALTILAQQGDRKASEALKDIQSADLEILNDPSDEHVELLLEYTDGTY